jgi:small nuclear ribonucleoprotein (snRNP)-like protein
MIDIEYTPRTVQMLFRIVPPLKGALTLRQVLQLTNMYLENASETDDHDIALVLCQHAEVVLSEAKSASKKASSSSNPEDQVLSKNVASAYYKLGKLLEIQDYRDQAQEFFKKSKKLG